MALFLFLLLIILKCIKVVVSKWADTLAQLHMLDWKEDFHVTVVSTDVITVDDVSQVQKVSSPELCLPDVSCVVLFGACIEGVLLRDK